MIVARECRFWKELKRYNIDIPYVIGGDLNCIMPVKERLGSHVLSSEIVHIKLCIQECNMSDLGSTCNFFTRKNKQHDSSKVY